MALNLGGHTWRGTDDPEYLAAARAEPFCRTRREAEQLAASIVALGLVLNAIAWLTIDRLVDWYFPSEGLL